MSEYVLMWIISLQLLYSEIEQPFPFMSQAEARPAYL